MKGLIKVLFSSAVVVLTYVVFALLMWEVNPEEWPDVVRWVCLALLLSEWVVLSVYIYAD